MTRRRPSGLAATVNGRRLDTTTKRLQRSQSGCIIDYKPGSALRNLSSAREASGDVLKASNPAWATRDWRFDSSGEAFGGGALLT